jgi:pimeloyl-ACP methyl ester carboxylesterase
VRVDEHTIELDGTPVFYRSAGEDDVPPLYLHGSPTSSEDWVALLERTGGIAPDLIGFGRSSKAGNLDYTLEGHADFIERLLSVLGVERVRLVAHDWGAGGGLVFAQRHPERIDRLVLIDALPLLDGFVWNRVGRTWRRPAVGELVMGSVTRWILNRELRRATVGDDVWSDERLRTVWEQFDQGTQRAILRLHRAADPELLAAAGAGLETLKSPALVLWGEHDPWFAAEFADAYAARLPHATVRRVAGAGHWPWLEQADVADSVATFLGED